MEGLRKRLSSITLQNADRVIQQFLRRPDPPGLQIETGEPHLRLRVVQRIHAYLTRAQCEQAFELAGGAVGISGFL